MNSEFFNKEIFAHFLETVSANVSPLHEVADFQHFWLQI